MRIISSQALAALDSGRFKVRALVKLMPSSHAPLCFWDDLGLIQVDGDVYSGAAGRFTLESAASVADMSTQTVNINFSALDPDIVSMVEGVSWSQQPALIQRVIIAIDAPQVLHVSEEFAGFMDQLFWEEGVGSTVPLKLQCVGASREYSRAAWQHVIRRRPAYA